MKHFQTAVIGCGAIHQNHLDAIASCPQADLYAVCDIDAAQGEKTAASANCKLFTSFDEVLADPAIDVVHLCTPHYLHAPMAIAAMKAGKDVLTEKPMAMGIYETMDMVRAARETGRTLGVCFQNRYNYTSQHVKSLLNSGSLGKVHGAKAMVTWGRDAKYYGQAPWRGTWQYEGGGVLINQAIHTLDLLQWFLGLPVSVAAQMSCYQLQDCIEVEDTAHGIFTFADGTRAIFYATNNYCTSSPIELEIVCEKAVLTLKDTLTIQYGDGRVEHSTETTLGQGEKAYWGLGHKKLIADYYACLAEGKPFWIDGPEASKAVRMIESIYRSAATGNRVPIPAPNDL